MQLITPQGAREQTVTFFNATLDTIKIQCDSCVFRFQPRGTAEIPFRLYQVFESQVRDKGVFAIYPYYTKDQIKQKELEALRHYKDQGDLKMRISNFFAYVDEMKKRGVTIEESPEMKRALRVRKELEAYLKEHKADETELSFFDEKKRKELGFSDGKFEQVISKLPSLDELTTLAGEKVLQANDKSKSKASASKKNDDAKFGDGIGDSLDADDLDL